MKLKLNISVYGETGCDYVYYTPAKGPPSDRQVTRLASALSAFQSLALGNDTIGFT